MNDYGRPEPPRRYPSSAEPPRRHPSSAEPPRRYPSSAEPPRRHPSSAEPPRRHSSFAEPPVGEHEVLQKDSEIVTGKKKVQYQGEPTSMESSGGDDERRPLSQLTLFDNGQDRSRDGRGYGPMKQPMRHEEQREYHPKSRKVNRFTGILNSFIGGGDDSEEVDRRPPGHYPARDDRNHRPRQEDMTRELGTLSEENYRLQEQLHQERIKFNGMQHTMDNKDLFLGGQALDDEVQGKFQSLLSQIRTWSSKFSLGPALTVEGVGVEIANEFEIVAPDCFRTDSDFWRSGRKLRMLIRGWVNFVITESIFRARSGNPNENNNALDRWMGETVQNAVATIEDKLVVADKSKISLRSFNDWRALTVELAARLDLGSVASQERDAYVADLAQKVMGVLSSFTPDDAKSEITLSLIQVLNASIEFSRFLRRQRVVWWVFGAFPAKAVENMPIPTRLPPSFDFRCMKDEGADDDEIEQREPRNVKLFLAPGLFKRGNIDGERYEIQDTVVHILVTCN